MAANSFSAESYFATQGTPSGLEKQVEIVREFVAKQVQQNRKVVLVTVCTVSLI